jgi:hypothetical protein
MRSRAIEELKKTLHLSEEQRETLVGLLLGDGCLETRDQGRTWRLKVEQSAQHEAYIRHLFEVFRPWVRSEPRQRLVPCSNGSITLSWVFQTFSHGAFRFYADQYYGDGGKRVPKLIHRWLTPRGLAYWYMDDGSMKSVQSKGVIFNTQGFAARDVDRLVEVLQSQFGLAATPRHQKEGKQIFVSGRSFEVFQQLVEPFLIAEMRYKIPQPRRTRLPKE